MKSQRGQIRPTGHIGDEVRTPVGQSTVYHHSFLDLIALGPVCRERKKIRIDRRDDVLRSDAVLPRLHGCSREAVRSECTDAARSRREIHGQNVECVRACQRVLGMNNAFANRSRLNAVVRHNDDE